MRNSKALVVSALLSVLVGSTSASVLAASKPNSGAKTPDVARLSQESQTLFGFTPFPYDFTLEAIERTHAIVAENSSIYGIHIDDAIPWQKALADAPFPPSLERKWNDIARGIPSGLPVYLGLTPLGKDRVSIGAALDREGKEIEDHDFTGRRLSDSEIQKAYLNYVLRATRLFKPRYLNIGIEAGEMASRKPNRWADFEALFSFVKAGIKKEFPETMVGISFGLQSLRRSDVAQRAKPLMESSDYVCLSFYPYASAFSEKFGAPPLPSGKAAWREPLSWIARYTKKPIAICETGYSTQNVELAQFDLKLSGDPASQADYVGELIDIAKRNQFLFVIWYLAVDYDKLYQKMPKGSEVNLLWRNIGLFDGDLRPKPGWNIWKTFRGAATTANLPVAEAPSPRAAPPAIPPSATQATAPLSRSANLLQLNFETGSDLFVCPGDLVRVEGVPESGQTAMRWDYEYSAGKWKWCAKDISNKSLGSAVSLDFRLRSDVDGPLFLKLEEKNKEAFYAIINATREWNPISFRLTELAIDPDTRQNGKLDTDNLATIILADPGSTGSAPGRRTIWVDDFNFR